MVSNVFPGHSFYHAGRYVSKKPGAELLDYVGVRGYDYKLMAEDFIAQSELRPSKQKACFHAALSFYPGEKPTDETMTQIAREYLEGLGIVNTQYVIVKHTDRAHLHLHILANMVDNDGKSIKDGWIGLQGKKVAQQLTRKYKLIPAKGKNLDLTHLEAMSQSEVNRYKIYQAIVDALPHCRTLKDLELRLMAQGIHTLYKYKGQTQELQGISFSIGKDRFKGSQIDRKFSLGNLQKALAAMRQNRDITAWLSPTERKKALLVRSATRKVPASAPAPTPQKALSPLILELLKPVEPEGGGVPYELTEAYLKKKRKKKGIGH
ncbi:MAG TPA: relaxase/mobilization nuclease domain-containing protein [Puia sp.]|nr:relaxase/mobilization nuclease domain-containing protein [Puia sp.]